MSRSKTAAWPVRCIPILLLCILLAGCSRPGSAGKTGKETGTAETAQTEETGQETETAQTAKTGQETGTAKTAQTAKTGQETGAAKTAQTAETAEEAVSAETSSTARPAETAEPQPEPMTQEQKTEKMIQEYLGTLSLEDKVSGLFLLTPEQLTGYDVVTEADDLVQDSLEKYPVAGLVFFSQNIVDRDQLKDLLASAREWGSASAEEIPPFLAVDEEGGIVLRIGSSAIDVPYVGSMASVSAGGDPEAAYEAGSTIGAYLQELGFNLDFAPDADVLVDPSNVTIGDRSFGSDPELCGQMVHRYVDGLHENGIASCIKHFPGLGDTESDTHTGAAWSSRSIEEYRSAEFLSFGGGIDAGTEMVMISHLSNSQLSGSDIPASLNKTIITDLLRSELGFEGLVITDSLRMGAIAERFDSAEAAVAAFEAGADILLMPSDFHTARQGILDAVHDGHISEERIDESLCRILRARASLAGLQEKTE